MLLLVGEGAGLEVDRFGPVFDPPIFDRFLRWLGDVSLVKLLQVEFFAVLLNENEDFLLWEQTLLWFVYSIDALRVLEVNERLQAGDLQPVTQKSELLLVIGRVVELVGFLRVSAVILKGKVEEIVASLL